MKGKIYFIMGKSSSGKDTIFKRLKENKTLGLKTIVGYTTRPMREGEVEGVEYHFVSTEELDKLKSEGKVIECRDYNTVHGIWSYFTVACNIDLENNDYLCIGTLESYMSMVEYYGVDYIIPIYIEVDDGIRLHRALSRERGQVEPNYIELCRRFLSDEEDFSEENIQRAGISTRFINGNLEDCISDILDYIKVTRRVVLAEKS